MMNSDKPSTPVYPDRLSLPIAVDESNKRLDLWTGESELRQGQRNRKGLAEVFIRMEPRPDICYRFTTPQEPPIHEFFAAIAEGDLSDCQIVCADPIGMISGRVSLDRLVEICGDVYPQPPDSHRYTSARFLIINGPALRGAAYSTKNGGFFCGRNTVAYDDIRVTVDQLSPEALKGNQPYRFTHIAEVKCGRPLSSEEIESQAEELFLALSLAAGRWVGVFGVWLYEEDKFTRYCPVSTKVSANGNSPSWLHSTMKDAFEELLEKLHASYKDAKRADVLQTVIHWLIESSLCAGGVEGSLVLLQAAFEAIAWFEIVHHRQLCSIAGFTSLPAVDKMRWFASRHSISAAIPPQCGSLVAYSNAFNEVNDLLDMLVDVRNALVHSSPKKIERLRRPTGSEERTELWIQVVFLLQLAVLATIDYRGEIVWRNKDSKLIYGAIGPVPWGETGK